MNHSRWIVWVVALGCLGFFGCGDKAAPTEPARNLAEMSIDKVASPPTGMSGAWNGTITFHAFSANFEGLACDGTAPIAVTLVEDSSSLTGRFQSGCAGELEIRGVIDSNRISGSLNLSTGAALGRISGTVASGRIQFRTITNIGQNEDGSTDVHGDGDSSLVSSEVDLHRLQLAVRTPPLLVDSGRSLRGLGTRR